LARKKASINKPKKLKGGIPIPPASNPWHGLQSPVDPKNPYKGYTSYKGKLYAGPNVGKKSTSTGAGAAPPPVAPPNVGGVPLGSSGFPEDAAYGQEVGIQQKSYADTMANIQRQRQDAANESGYSTDQVTAVASPYSQANMLERSYKQDQARSTNSFAARGQLYSGSLQNSQNQNRFGYDQGVDSGRKKFEQLMAGLGYQEQQAGSQRDLSVLGAGQGALGRAQANEPVDPGYSASPGIPSPGNPTQGSRTNPTQGSRTNLTPAQRKTLTKRTTPTSKQRYINKYGK